MLKFYNGFLFFFNNTPTTEFYTLSLHDALPIYPLPLRFRFRCPLGFPHRLPLMLPRSEEHTSELQSRPHLVCRLLLEKKNACNMFVRSATEITASQAHHQ